VLVCIVERLDLGPEGHQNDSLLENVVLRIHIGHALNFFAIFDCLAYVYTIYMLFFRKYIYFFIAGTRRCWRFFASATVLCSQAHHV
jgi:hypothetical protein